MTSTGRTRLLQLQRRFSFGLSHHHHHHHQHQRYSSSPLLKGLTTLPHLLPISHGDFWSKGFATTTYHNEKSESDNEVKRVTRTWKYTYGSIERDLRVKFTHTGCGTQMERLVCKKCYETGAVVTRCTGCNAYAVIANHYPNRDSTVCVSQTEAFFAANGVRLEEGSDDTLNCFYEVREEEIDLPEPHSVRAIWDETKSPHTNLVKWVESDTTMSFTHSCGAKLTRRICKRAWDRGLVVVRCDDCKKFLIVADYHGWVQKPRCTEHGELAEWFGKEPGRTSLALVAQFEKELEEDSKDSLNYTIEESVNYTHD